MDLMVQNSCFAIIEVGRRDTLVSNLSTCIFSFRREKALGHSSHTLLLQKPGGHYLLHQARVLT